MLRKKKTKHNKRVSGSTKRGNNVLIILIEHFIRRIPLVHSALKAYENSSSVVKYGAEMIESYAGPIYDKLGYDRKLKEVYYKPYLYNLCLNLSNS